MCESVNTFPESVHAFAPVPRPTGPGLRSQYPQLMLWVAWLVNRANHKIADDEALLMRHLVRVVREQHQVVDEQLARLVEIDPAEVWQRIDAEPGT